MKTVIHTYLFDTRNEYDKAAYTALCARMKAAGIKCFETHGGEGHYFPVKPIDAQEIELQTDYLFQNQWNTAPIEGISDTGLRVFDWAQDSKYTDGGIPPYIKRGHYLDITEEMREILHNTAVCGYCGKQEPVHQGYVFCPHCLDSEYLLPGELHLTRMLPVDSKDGRDPLSEAESNYLLPLYKKAQIEGNTARGIARLAKKKANIEREYEKAIKEATIKRDAANWIMSKCPQLLANHIYYPHTGRHCFGWRKPVSEDLLPDLLAVISEFPFDYDIKCDNGRTLSN